MKNPSPHQHPLDNPAFEVLNREPVFYMAHPIAADERFTYDQNMEHVKHMLRLCFDEGFRVVAPYYVHLTVFDDDNAEHRRIGLETDCRVAHLLGRIILTGHKRSRGMMSELEAVEAMLNGWLANIGDNVDTREIIEASCIVDITDMNDAGAREVLQQYKALAASRG